MDTTGFSEHCNTLFQQAIEQYHLTDSVEALPQNPYEAGTLDYLLFLKNWIDTVQWHLEDIIRDPQIDPVAALALKRRIDKSNQDRTDLVERVDSYFFENFSGVSLLPGATLNTETPAWAIDRLSILALKIYHFHVEANREGAPASCVAKWQTLCTQRKDLSLAINQLLSDLQGGRKYMKLYKQMKMYNDPSLNPVLYAKK